MLPSKVPSGVRPTSARVREAIFSMLGQDLQGVRFLDGYGGTGVMALEAASRNADVVVIERSGRAMKAILENGQSVGVTWQAERGELLTLCSSFEPFDIIFLDPPYTEAVEPILRGVADRLRPNGVLLYEADKRAKAPNECLGLKLVRTKIYGNSKLLIYRETTV